LAGLRRLVLTRPSGPVLLCQPSQRGEIRPILRRRHHALGVFLRRFEDQRDAAEPRMIDEQPEGFAADLALADRLVAVDPLAAFLL
jgi:hypothetical protein